jgi:hypothetical protein
MADRVSILVYIYNLLGGSNRLKRRKSVQCTLKSIPEPIFTNSSRTSFAKCSQMYSYLCWGWGRGEARIPPAAPTPLPCRTCYCASVQFTNFVREMFTDVQLPVRQSWGWGGGRHASQEAKYVERWPNTTSALAGWSRFDIPVTPLPYDVFRGGQPMACGLFGPTEVTTLSVMKTILMT